MKIGYIEIDLPADWSSIILPPNSKLIGMDEGESPWALHYVSPKDFEVYPNGWVLGEKWLILSTGIFAGGQERVENLPDLEVQLDGKLWTHRVGISLFKVDSDGPFNVEEPAWNGAHVFQQPE